MTEYIPRVPPSTKPPIKATTTTQHPSSTHHSSTTHENTLIVSEAYAQVTTPLLEHATVAPKDKVEKSTQNPDQNEPTIGNDDITPLDDSGPETPSPPESTPRPGNNEILSESSTTIMVATTSSITTTPILVTLATTVSKVTSPSITPPSNGHVSTILTTVDARQTSLRTTPTNDLHRTSPMTIEPSTKNERIETVTTPPPPPPNPPALPSKEPPKSLEATTHPQNQGKHLNRDLSTIKGQDSGVIPTRFVREGNNNTQNTQYHNIEWWLIS